jgi:hypothetical protein
MKPRIRSSDTFIALHTISGAPSEPVESLPRSAPVEPAAAPLRPIAAQRSVLETMHPGIAHAITLLWGYPEMNEYFAKLWMADDRLSPIHPEAMSELMLLARVHEHLSPAQAEVPAKTIYGTQYTAQLRPRTDTWETVSWRR